MANAEAGDRMEVHASVGAMLRHWATAIPDAPMFTQGDRTVTWSEFHAHACRVGTALRRAGVTSGDRVAFLDRNGIDFFSVFFGCVLIGAVDVSLNWRLAPAEMAAIVEDSGARVLFTSDDFAACAAAIEDAVPRIDTVVRLEALDAWLEEMAPGPCPDPGHGGEPHEAVIQLYTSGTTGLPKGVMISNANFEPVLRDADTIFCISQDTVSLVAMPLFHIGGTGWALAGMSRGGHSVILRDVDPGEALRLIAHHGITEAFFVPALLMFMLSDPRMGEADLTSLRTVFYGASPISEEVLTRSLEAFGCSFAQVYGLTETTGAVTSLMPEDHDPGGPRAHLLRSAGRPFPHVELRIVDPETRTEVPTGQVGEVQVRSPQNMLGYWNRPEETAKAIDPHGWFGTGDAGWLDEQGYLFLHDRIKDMIVSGGENVYPAEVENVLLAHPRVADAAVIGVPDQRWGETVKAVIVLDTGVVAESSASPGDAGDLARDLIDFCRQRLAHYKCPTSVDVVDALPRNPSGKILKRELRAPYWADRSRAIH